MGGVGAANNWQNIPLTLLRFAKEGFSIPVAPLRSTKGEIPRYARNDMGASE